MKQWRTFLTQCEIVLHCALSPIYHKEMFKAVCLGGQNKQLCFLPTGCSIQCVIEDQSLWPTGGLLQPLAEPHTNKLALDILKLKL